MKPEINGVINAIAVLETSGNRDEHVLEAINQLRLYLEFLDEYERAPLYWHMFREMKERNGKRKSHT